MAKLRKFIDIGANLTDEMFKGVYHGTKKHNQDLELVIKRCWEGGIEKMIITGGSLTDSGTALALAETDKRLFSTVGCHPTRCTEFELDSEEYLIKLKKLAIKGGSRIVAIGECGLDYDRLQFCQKDFQKKYFEEQLQLCEDLNLPLFLHCRAAWDDFFDILSRNQSKLRGGVVHSFDGSENDMKRAIDMGLYIGINGCSLKTIENLAVAAKIPKERLLMETDCPWCEIKPTHAGAQFIKTHYPTVKKEKFTEGSMVKGRNEPTNIMQVLEILAGIRNEDVDILCQQVYDNTNKLFFSR